MPPCCGSGAGVTAPSASGVGRFSSSSTKRCSVPTASPRLRRSPTPRSRRCASGRAGAAISIARSSPSASSVARSRSAAGPTMFTTRRARTVSGSSSVGLLHREPLEQRRGPGPRPARSPRARPRPTTGTRTPPGRPDRRTATRRSSRPRARAGGSPSAARPPRAGRRRPARRRTRSRLVGLGAGVARHRRPGHRVLDRLVVEAGATRDLLDVLLAQQLARDLAQHRRREVDGARPTLGRGEVGAREHTVELELRERATRSRPPSRARSGSSRQRSPGSLPGGSAATFTSMSNRCSHWYHFSAAFCPAASASYARTTWRVNDFRICTWSSASAVPHVATALGTPASVKPMTSV